MDWPCWSCDWLGLLCGGCLMEIKFNSMTEIADALDKSKHHYESNTAWTGGETADQVAHKLRNGGDVKIAAKAKEYLDNFNVNIQTERPSHVSSPYGGRFIIPEAILGWPEPARRLVRRMEDAAPLTLYFSNTCSGGIDVNHMLKRGMAIMAFVMAMSYIRPVKVVYFSELGGKDADKWTNVTFEVPTAPMSLSEAAYCLGSMSLTRGAVYAIGQQSGNGYHGQWAGHYERLGGSRRSPEYTEYLRKAFKAREDDVIIGSVYVDDPLIKDPLKWLKETLKEYIGES